MCFRWNGGEQWRRAWWLQQYAQFCRIRRLAWYVLKGCYALGDRSEGILYAKRTWTVPRTKERELTTTGCKSDVMILIPHKLNFRPVIRPPSHAVLCPLSTFTTSTLYDVCSPPRCPFISCLSLCAAGRGSHRHRALIILPHHQLDQPEQRPRLQHRAHQ